MALASGGDDGGVDTVVAGRVAVTAVVVKSRAEQHAALLGANLAPQVLRVDFAIVADEIGVQHDRIRRLEPGALGIRHERRVRALGPEALGARHLAIAGDRIDAVLDRLRPTRKT
jgi:hypothetical protein